jgi:hypothetical protein
MSSYQVAAITANIAKTNQGFIAANQRQACSNCKHGKEQREERMPPYDATSWKCKLGGFRTTAKAICNQYASKEGRAT